MRIPFTSKQGHADLRIEVASGTDVGLRRQRNEDSLLCLEGEECPTTLDALLAVADGMGGHVDGDIASQMAVDALSRLIIKHLADQKPHSVEWPSLLSQVLKDANFEIHAESLRRKQTVPMGTTCTMAVVFSGTAYITHAGDSRAYLYRSGILAQLTTDHSWVQQQVSEGLLSPEQARVHPHRNVVTNALGISPEIEVETVTKGLQKEDILLISSDGVHGLIEDSGIASMLKITSIEESKDSLIENAKEAGGHDNITAVLAAVR